MREEPQPDGAYGAEQGGQNGDTALIAKPCEQQRHRNARYGGGKLHEPMQ